MKKRKSGSTLVAVLITVTVVSAMLGVVTNVTRFQARNSNRTILRSQAIAYGDAVIESLYDQWRVAMIGATNSLDRSNGLTESALAAVLRAPTATQLPAPQGITLVSWSVKAVNPLLGAPTVRTDGRPDPEQGSTSRLRMRLYYLASVKVNFNGVGATDSVTVERPFIRSGRNLFDNFFFGTEPEIEFHPGPPMYVDGKVYVGGDLYTATDSLHFLTDVSYLGDHTLDYRPADPHKVTPTIDSGGNLSDNWVVDNPPRKGAEQKLFDTRTDQLDSNFLDDPNSNDTDSDGNLNNDGYHEMLEEPTGAGTDPLQLDPDTSERLSKNADYRIYVDASNNISVYKGNSSTALPVTSAEYVAIKGAMTTNTALRDVREADNVRVTTLDVGLLKTATDTGKVSDNINPGDGLLIYFTDTSVGTSVNTVVKNSSTGATTAVTSSKKRGIKLVNGASLPSIGLTVATPNIAYIQGDYNSGKTSTTQPPSNTATSYTPPNDKPSPVVTNYNRAPAAVAGDAVNILSNAWNDANSLLAKSSRIASNTTINTAIIAGNVPTTSASYSGGIENFSRFHEDWSNKYLTLYGTLAQLFNSEQAKGTWGAADYTPPNRRWYYDTKLQDANPPGFRIARVYERGRWTTR